MFQRPVPGWMPYVPMVTQEKPFDWPSLLSTRYDGNSRGNWNISADTRKVRLDLIFQLLFYYE